MSAKNLDKHNRFRCITVGFRQEYCYQKCMNRDIVVQPNPRVHKALKVQMEELTNELKRFEHGKDIPPELLDTIKLITVTMNGLKGGENNGL